MKKNRVLSPILALGSSAYWTSIAFAQTTGEEWITKLKEETEGPESIAAWLPVVINLAIGLAALVCVAVLIGAGYMYITASGDEAKVEKATKSITYAIVGLVICFISVILVQFVLKSVLGQQ